MKKLPQLLLLLAQLNLYGQTATTDLTAHTDFFQRQSLVYQAWLESTNLSAAFVVHEVKVSPEGEGVILNLLFSTPAPDTLLARWSGAKASFEAENTLTLEEALFLKMLRLFDLQSKQALVQIRNSYKPYGEQYFVKIYTLDDHLKVERKFYKGYFDNIPIQVKQLRRASSEKGFDAPVTKSEVYRLICEFIEEKYVKKKSCADEAPSFDPFFSTKNTLLVNISGLCREVLTQEEELLFCSILKRLDWDCNNVKREALSFEFDFDDQSSKIYCQLDGKYNNNYLLFHGEERDMDDDPQFEKLLQSHGENFLKALKVWIEQR